MGPTFEQERQWQRVHRFRKWNESGAPGGLVRFAYAHPTMIGLVLVASVLTGLGWLVTTQGLGTNSAIFGALTLLSTAAGALQLRSGQRHLDAWEGADADERQRVADQDHDTASPIASRLLTVYGVVGGLLLTALLVAMVVTAGT